MGWRLRTPRACGPSRQSNAPRVRPLAVIRLHAAAVTAAGFTGNTARLVLSDMNCSHDEVCPWPAHLKKSLQAWRNYSGTCIVAGIAPTGACSWQPTSTPAPHQVPTNLETIMGGWRGDEGCQMWHVSEGSGHHMLHKSNQLIIGRLRTTDSSFTEVED